MESTGLRHPLHPRVVEGQRIAVQFKLHPAALTGPNLYGLFLNQPRDREVVAPGSDKRRKVKADKNYFTTSVRKSWDALAVAESGANRGEAYPQIMPKSSP